MAWSGRVIVKAVAPEAGMVMLVGPRELSMFRFKEHHCWCGRTGLLTELELEVRSHLTPQGKRREAQTGTCRVTKLERSVKEDLGSGFPTGGRY